MFDRRRATYRALGAVAIMLAAIPPASAVGVGPGADIGSPAGSFLEGGPTSTEQAAVDLQTIAREKGALGLYQRDDGTVVVVIPASLARTFTAQNDLQFGFAVEVEQVDIEQSEIDEIETTVAHRDWHPDARSFQVGVMFDPRLGTIRLMSDAPPSVFAYFEKRYPGKVHPEQLAMQLTSRNNDWEPHYGGARIGPAVLPGSWNCTSGFSVKTASLKTRMLTAGHCYELNDGVFSKDGTSFGSVKTDTNDPGGGLFRKDFALLGLGVNDVTMGPYIYYGGATDELHVGVSGTATTNFSNRYCYSGGQTFQNCGHRLINSDYAFCPAGRDYCLFDLQWFESTIGNGGCQGDSGSPFYVDEVSSTVRIAGLLVAGEKEPNIFDPSGTPCNQHTVAIIETWASIHSTLGVTIKTI